MRTKCPISMKQMTLEREFHKLLLYAKKLILTYDQFRLLLSECLTFMKVLKLLMPIENANYSVTVISKSS